MLSRSKSIQPKNNNAPLLQHFFRRIIIIASTCYCYYCFSTTFLVQWLHFHDIQNNSRHKNNKTLCQGIAFAFPQHHQHVHRSRYRQPPPSRSTNLYSYREKKKKTNTEIKHTKVEHHHQQQQEKQGGEFSHKFRKQFETLLSLRRDVRHFDKDRPVSEELLNDAIHVAFNTAPSVGLSEPWRIVRVQSPTVRNRVYQNFVRCNALALEGYKNKTTNTNTDTKNGSSSISSIASKAEMYASLKLSGMKEAPVHLAIFCNEGTSKGSGLGSQTMPEMKRYSVVCAIQSFWLLARSMGLGVGWVSILDPEQLLVDLDLQQHQHHQQQQLGNNGNRTATSSSSWTLVGYLCVGYPDEKKMDGSRPELERFGWEERRGKQEVLLQPSPSIITADDNEGVGGEANDVGSDHDGEDFHHLYRNLPIIVV